MTGRRLYDLYCDETAAEFPRNRGGYFQPAEEPLPAWPSLARPQRYRWNSLAKRITPKRKAVQR